MFSPLRLLESSAVWPIFQLSLLAILQCSKRQGLWPPKVSNAHTPFSSEFYGDVLQERITRWDHIVLCPAHHAHSRPAGVSRGILLWSTRFKYVYGRPCCCAPFLRKFGRRHFLQCSLLCGVSENASGICDDLRSLVATWVLLLLLYFRFRESSPV